MGTSDIDRALEQRLRELATINELIKTLTSTLELSEILRIVPGSSLVVAPADTDFATQDMATGLEDSFGGGGYSALQRAALLQLASDHVSSALDGRESAFELHASGGMPNWRAWLRQNFRDYNELANAVLKAIDLAMPQIDVGNIPAAPIARRRPVTAQTNSTSSFMV